MKDTKNDMVHALEQEIHARVHSCDFSDINTTELSRTLTALALARLTHVLWQLVDEDNRLRVIRFEGSFLSENRDEEG